MSTTSVTGVDFESKSLRCREVFKGTEHDFPYDYLVIATGAQNNTFGVPGVSEVILSSVSLVFSREKEIKKAQHPEFIQTLAKIGFTRGADFI